MNIFNKVTLQSLKKNKVRTIVTIIGIVLSASMICAVTTFAASIYNYVYENAVYENGDWHGSTLNVEWETYETIARSEKVGNSVYAQQLGYAVATNCINEFKPYIYVLGASEGFHKTMPIHLISGNYPTSQKEILLPEHLRNNGGVHYNIGDILTLDLGERVSEGHTLWQNTPNYVYDYIEGVSKAVTIDESLHVKESRTYTVVGFYERPNFENYDAPGYTAITLADETPSATHSYEVYYKMKNPRDYYDFVKEYKISGDANRDVLQYSGATGYGGIDRVITGLAAIVIGLIMFGSIALIYNAFSISVSERTKQFGLLASVGATKKQLKRMVIFEAFAVSAIGIPLGIIAGIGGIGVTLSVIGNKFSSLSGYEIPMRVCVSPVAIIVAVVIALITVLISAWIPSKRATKVSAIQAIRQSVDVKAKGRKVKSPKWVYKIFGLPGLLANKYYKRDRKKYRATVVSLFMSVVLFVSASSFADYLLSVATYSFVDETYDIIYSEYKVDYSNVIWNEFFEELRSADKVTDAAYLHRYYFDNEINKEFLSEQGIAYAKTLEFEGEIDETEKRNEDVVTVLKPSVVFVDDETFKELLKDNHLDEKTYMNPEKPLGVAVDNKTYIDEKEGTYHIVNCLNSDKAELTVYVEKYYEGYTYLNNIYNENKGLCLRYVSDDNPEKVMDIPYTPYGDMYDKVVLRSGKTITERPFYIEDSISFALVYPECVKSSIFPCMSDNSGLYYFKSSNHSVSYSAIKEIVSKNGFSTSHIYNYAEMEEENRNLITIIQVFSYGFIVLISLIAAANVFNTISTNISLRRREFAMLKSVGMTAKGFNRMMNYECILYGSKSLLCGLPVSVGITYLIYMVITDGYTMKFILPWGAIGVAAFSVFLVVFATMIYSMSKIKKDNPIDALKNENL